MIYGTLALALAYHALAGNTGWSAIGITDDQRTQAMFRARRVLDGRWGRLFTGSKATVDQPKAWPRVGAYDVCAGQDLPDGVIPNGVLEASYELALAELVKPGALSPTFTVGRMTKSEGVDGAANRSFFSPDELKAFGDDPTQNMRPTLLAAADLLTCYITPNWRHWAAMVV